VLLRTQIEKDIKFGIKLDNGKEELIIAKNGDIKEIWFKGKANLFKQKKVGKRMK